MTMGSVHLRSKIVSGLKSFLSNQSGNTAQLVALSAVPLLLSMGAAVDTVRMGRERTAFLGAVDSAALALASDDRSVVTGVETTDAANLAALKVTASNFINANYISSTGAANDITIDLAVTNQTITMTAHHNYPTAFMGLMGINSLDVSSTSVVNKAMRPVELTMVMDTTGSMATSSKISGAKTAAHKLLTTLYGGSLAAYSESPYIRVSLVPFTAAVRLNTSAYDFDLGWIDTTGANPLSHLNFNDATWNNYMAWGKIKDSVTNLPMAWDGCVEARAKVGGIDYTVGDQAPDAAVPNSLFPALFSPDTPTYGSYGYDYITTSGTPNENTGLTSAQKVTSSTSSPTDARLLYQQKNQAKYDGVKLAAESTSTTGPWSGCAVSAMVPMTYNRAHIETGIDAMVAAGPTLIAEGLNWGLRSISPGAPLTKVEAGPTVPASTIAPYNDVRWHKVMVLMTDGDNDLGAGYYGFNGDIYSAYGRSREPNVDYNRVGVTADASVMGALDQRMLDVCTAIKANNIELYVTAFGTGVSATTKSRLQSCATDAAHYTTATDSIALTAFFDSIGQNTLNKMIFVSK